MAALDLQMLSNSIRYVIPLQIINMCKYKFILSKITSTNMEEIY